MNHTPPTYRHVAEPTGTVRVRFRRGWFFTRTIVEREYFVEIRKVYSSINDPALRVDRAWVSEKPANVTGRTFFSDTPWQPYE